MDSLNLCIIDDDDVYRQTLARSLERLDCRVAHFATPLQAIETLSASKQDLSSEEILILLDLKLENTSGLQWIKKIKQQLEPCRILLVTGYASISTAVEAIKLGADDYLTKPINAREIIQHLTDETEEDTKNSYKPMSVERLEWEYIHKILKDNHGNISASARALGMHRRTLQRKLSKKPVRN